MASETDVFSALADPTRRRLLESLCRDGECSVHALTGQAGISQPAVSKHLAVLKRAGLVTDRRQGRETYYSFCPHGLSPVVDWMSLYGQFWAQRFDALEDLLRRTDI
ncbi:ArsR/SmtB family transcription factor [Amorphus sp. 3PC139-8]|uniref:ArsR/SmtB family transcription factor n=1 Tax=Amorphus sp. 3PC139-8 TaxID=2735676 RepID=UPI00345CADC1